MLDNLIFYDLKVATLTAVFYLFYKLLLARETTYSLNRMVLLSCIILSAVLPLCIVTLHRTVVVNMPMASTAIDNAAPLPLEEAFKQRFDWTTALAALLLAGTFIRLLHLTQSYRKLNKIISGGEKHTLPSGTKVCVVEAPFAPFSWMKTIVLPTTEWPSPSPSILAHEEAHVRHRHSYDVVVVELLTALQWFNPVAWFMRQELRILHEYEADASVLSHGFNESQYIHLLMQKATGIQACALANGIRTPKTKRRILMILKTKSKRSTWLKALYVVPIVMASLAITAKTVVVYETDKPKDSTAVRMFKEKTNGKGDCYQIRYQPGVRFFRNGHEEKIPNGRAIALEVSKTTMLVNGKPVDEATLFDIPIGALKEIHLTETGSAQYTINIVTESERGKKIYIVDDEEVTEKAASNLRNEDIASVDVIETKETIKEALHKDADAAVMVQTKKPGDDKVFVICEQMPQFPGGEAELMQFIARNIKYPETAIENGVQGRVLVRFIVEKDGSLTNPEVLASSPGIGETIPIEVTAYMGDKERQDAEVHNAGVKALNEEAIRVVNAMPRWSPGKQGGKAVRCYYTLPVTYRLN